MVAFYLLFCGTCWLGLQVCPNRSTAPWEVLFLALVKMLVSIPGGVVVFFFSGGRGVSGALVMGIVYLVTTWLEWGFVEPLVAEVHQSPTGLLVGYSDRTRAWRCAAVAFSSMAWGVIVVSRGVR
jgi:hypothetical protein